MTDLAPLDLAAWKAQAELYRGENMFANQVLRLIAALEAARARQATSDELIEYYIKRVAEVAGAAQGIADAYDAAQAALAQAREQGIRDGLAAAAKAVNAWYLGSVLPSPAESIRQLDPASIAQGASTGGHDA